MNTISKITIIGSGYVGLSSAAIFANAGYDVCCLDIDQSKIDTIKKVKSFFYEEGLEELLQKAIEDGTLTATTSYKDAVADADFIFSCVGTPDRPDGSSNLDFVFSAAEETAKNLTKDVYYVQKSTVPVGTGRKVMKLFEELDSLKYSIKYLSNPEFLREGTSVFDAINGDRMVVGGDAEEDVEKVLDIYRQVEHKKHYLDDISKAGTIDAKTKYVSMSIESAELTKVTANSFLALKISFANSIAKLADKTGGNINEIMEAVGMDKRIGRSFLYAGRGYGGGCFPKDVSGLIASTEEYGLDLAIMQAADAVNISMPDYIVENLVELVHTVKGKKVAVLGTAFKEGTSDVRKSPSIAIANKLSSLGATIIAYDPKASKDEVQEALEGSVKIKKTAADTVKGADVVLIGTMWEEFKKLDLAAIKESMNGDVFVDCMNGFDKSFVEENGFKYLGVGTNN